MSDAISFGIEEENEGSLEWLIKARDPVAVTILLLHGANPGASIGELRKNLPLCHTHFLYKQERREIKARKHYGCFIRFLPRL